MTITITSGQRSAYRSALDATSDYRKAKLKFGRLIDPYRGHAPKALGLAHLLRVNPTLEVAPTPTKDRRRGFMLATIGMARTAGIDWENLDEPLTCAYVWGRDINADAKSLYFENTDLFPQSNSDFWKCAYLKHVLGNAAFSVVWQARDTTQSTIYDSLLYAVNPLRKSLPGWPIIKLRHTVLIGCAFVFEVAKRGGGLTSEGYGIEPVLKKASYQQVFE